MPTYKFDENKDSVKILQYYERLVVDAHKSAGLDMDKCEPIHIGGDQKTRERFSNAANLGLGMYPLSSLHGTFRYIDEMLFVP